MNVNKNISDSQLRELFKEVTLDNPSFRFTEKLMAKIEKEAVKEKNRKKRLSYGLLATGIASMILLPTLAIYVYGLFVPEFAFSFSFPQIHLHFDANLIAIGFAVLLLLVADTLYRKHLHSK
jgi:hypothetical protein